MLNPQPMRTHRPKLLEWTGLEPRDWRLKPWAWLNEDRAQAHYFLSNLCQGFPELGILGYPDMIEYRPKIIAKPGRITYIPHRFYRIFSRDATDVRGREIYGYQIEDASPTSFSHGDAFGHEA